MVIVPFLSNSHKRDYGHFIEDKFETLKFNIACHEHYRSQIAYDLILVDNGSEFEPGIEYMKSLPYEYIRRENEGFGFGGWKHAWDLFNDSYDYYLFCEDDQVPTKHGWLLEIITRFLQEPYAGALGNYVEARGIDESGSDVFFRVAGNQRPIMYNLDGGWMFTSSKILKENNGLHLADLTVNAPTVTECILQHPIMDLGYRIIGMADEHRYYIHGSSVFDPGPETNNDLSTITPIINCNGVKMHPKIKEYFAWHLQEN